MSSFRESTGPLAVGLAVAAATALVVSTSSSGQATQLRAHPGGPPATPTRTPARQPAPISPPTASPPGPAATGPAQQSSAPRTVSIVLTGDVLLHNTVWRQARRDAAAGHERGFDFRPMMASVRPVISDADLAVCHLETPLAPAGGPYSSYPRFSVPPQITTALAWAGYDGCTTASNHSLDAGQTGVRRTLAALDRARIAHAGSARSSTESDRPMWLQAAGWPGGGRWDERYTGLPAEPAQRVRVAVLSYTQMLNGLSPPAGRSWIVNTIDVRTILADAHRARAAGADLVLVALHWGVEYEHQPTSDQRRIARRLLASPSIDLVYGHHAHVVQPFQKIGAKWVAYGLGNHIADQRGLPIGTREGALARFTFTERPDGRWVSTAEYLPTYITTGSSLRVVDLGRALADRRTTGAPRSTYQRAWRDVAGDVGADDGQDAGLRAISFGAAG